MIEKMAVETLILILAGTLMLGIYLGILLEQTIQRRGSQSVPVKMVQVPQSEYDAYVANLWTRTQLLADQLELVFKFTPSHVVPAKTELVKKSDKPPVAGPTPTPVQPTYSEIPWQ